MASNQNISKRRKAVADGVFYAELSEFFMRELANEGYSGCEVRVTHARTEIIIRATHTQVGQTYPVAVAVLPLIPLSFVMTGSPR